MEHREHQVHESWKERCMWWLHSAGNRFYWEMQAQAIVDWNKLKSVNVSKSRADIFHYETQLKLKELKCSKGKTSDVGDMKCIKKVDLLLEGSEDET